MHAWYPHTGQKRELELQMAESCHIDAGNQTWVISGSSHCSRILETAVLGSELKESADVLHSKSSPFSISKHGSLVLGVTRDLGGCVMLSLVCAWNPPMALEISSSVSSLLPHKLVANH